MQGFRKKALPAAISLALGTGALLPVAAQAGWYVGLGAGQSSFDESGISTSDLEDAISDVGDIENVSGGVDDSDTGWKVFGGYRFNEYFALEGFYADLGSLEATFSGDGTFDGGEGAEPFSFSGGASADVEGFGVNAVVSYPVLDFMSVFASAGMLRWEAEASGSVTATADGDSETFADSIDDEGVDLKYGAGVAFEFMEHLGVQIEWENFSIDSEDVDLFSGSVTWEF